MSVEHLFLALIHVGKPATLKKYFESFGLDRAKVLAELKKLRGNQRVTTDNPESTYDRPVQVRHRPRGAGAQGQDRPGHRPRRRDPPRHPHPFPQDQEQSRSHRRARRRQNRHRRGPRTAHRARRRARGAEGQDHLRARPGRARRRREVPR
ncbi:MAG: Clp protease N-terminal domain-containing protein [Lacunisphaera sp.]